MFCSPETEQVFEQLFEEKEVILFGEGYTKRRLKTTMLRKK